ncbi:hypothetical protein [Pseudotenacibaculum haliotis]|uniref:Uncharacterized protein n=1 Tax=Pseudotenacibaculum haliotis TaxID=1862138 RepID=A0ABW5LRU4_9FLAO
MVLVRQPGFEFEEEESPEFDWDTMTSEEIDAAIEELNQFSNQDSPIIKRYNTFIPEYAHNFLQKINAMGVYGYNESEIMSYLEHEFEVDMNNLLQLGETHGLVEFSTGNFPYGGMDRFLMVLKSFELMPTECFNGFTIYDFKWTSDLAHDALEKPEETKKYLERMKR